MFKAIIESSNLQMSQRNLTFLKLSSVIAPKVIIDKFRGEVSLLEQDTIENVS